MEAVLVIARLVVVALVVVESTVVKLVMVEVALLTRIPPLNVESPVAESVDERVMAPVTPSVPPTVVLPKVAPPTASVVAKRLVEEAVVAKKLVEVAFVNTAVVLKKLVEVAEVEVESVVVKLVIVDVELFENMPLKNVARPVDWKVEDANNPPVALEKISLTPDESSIFKRLASWPAAARIERGIAEVEVASIVTCELPIGEVVPKEDGVVVPETAPAS